MHRPLGLAVEAFDRNKAHGRAAHRLADAFGIAPVVLVALDVGRHIGRRHQPRLVPEAHGETPPMMGAAAGLHADDRRRQLG
jgi:hypothetical protein